MVVIESGTVNHAGETFDVTIRNGKWYCPYSNCQKGCASDNGVKQHLSNAHGDYSRGHRTCEHCGESFPCRSYKNSKFCSMDCANKNLHGDTNDE